MSNLCDCCGSGFPKPVCQQFCAGFKRQPKRSTSSASKAKKKATTKAYQLSHKKELAAYQRQRRAKKTAAKLLEQSSGAKEN